MSAGLQAAWTLLLASSCGVPAIAFLADQSRRPRLNFGWSHHSCRRCSRLLSTAWKRSLPPAGRRTSITSIPVVLKVTRDERWRPLLVAVAASTARNCFCLLLFVSVCVCLCLFQSLMMKVCVCVCVRTLCAHTHTHTPQQ